MRIFTVLVDLVHELHDGGNGGVRGEALAQVARDLVDRPVGLAQERRRLAAGVLGWRLDRGAVKSRQEMRDARDSLVGPVAALRRVADEEDVAARGVRAVALDVVTRADRV